MSNENGNWQELCEAASKEADSERLMGLVTELIQTLEQRKIPNEPRER